MRCILRPLALAAVLAATSAAPAAAATLRVAAAPSAQDALQELAKSFQVGSSDTISFSWGSSGKLAAQISQGAPFDLFFAADDTAPAALEAKGLVRDRRAYARGRLVLWARQDTGLAVSGGLTLLTKPPIGHVAIANPQLAPYGRAAIETLRAAGIYEAVAPKLVIGENVAQAAQFVESGAAPVGLIALSVARSPRMAGKGSYWVVPARYHRPILAEAAVVKASRQGGLARRFLNYVTSPAGRPVWERYGFEAP